MLSKDRIQEVIFNSLFEPSTPTVENKIAIELGLAPGSVVLGTNPNVIAITEEGATRYVQISGDGRSIVFVDPAELQNIRTSRT